MINFARYALDISLLLEKNCNFILYIKKNKNFSNSVLASHAVCG